MTKKTLKNKVYIISILMTAIFFLGMTSYSNGQSATLSPKKSSDQNIDFIIDWSADTYAPPEYEGRTLPSYGSKITLSATPSSPINENDFQFNWTIDLAFVPDNNKKSKASFIARESTGGEHIIYLNIINKDTGETVKEATLSIPIVSPQNIIFKETQTGHLASLGIDNLAAPGSQMDLVAKPYFFNAIQNDQLLKYNWRLNNQALQKNSAEDPSKLAIKFPKNIGSSIAQYGVSLTIENPFDAFQFAENNYKITVK